jgi:hypothetical protein
MFKYLLLQSIETTAYVFSTFDSRTKEPTTEECKLAIKTYNKQARQVWSQEKESIVRRRHQCSAIYEQEILSLRRSVEVGDFRPMPEKVAEKMDDIFKATYHSPAEYLAFGRFDDISYLANGSYARHASSALGAIDSRYEARAVLCLSPLEGRGGSLPLMTKASVDAMWEVCESYFYAVQLKVVSTKPAVAKRTLRSLSALRVDGTFPGSDQRAGILLHVRHALVLSPERWSAQKGVFCCKFAP